MSNNFITVKELAESLRVPMSWVYSRSRETGPDAMPKLVVGKYRRFVLADVLGWLDKKQELHQG